MCGNQSEDVSGCGLNNKVLSSGPSSSVAVQGAVLSSAAAKACPVNGSLQSIDRGVLTAGSKTAQNAGTDNDVHEDGDREHEEGEDRTI